MSWRFSPPPLLSLSHIATLCSALSPSPWVTPFLMQHIQWLYKLALRRRTCCFTSCLFISRWPSLSACVMLFHVSLGCFGSSAGLILTADQLAGMSERELALSDLVKWSTCWSKWGAQCSVTKRTRHKDEFAAQDVCKIISLLWRGRLWPLLRELFCVLQDQYYFYPLLMVHIL